MKNSSSFIILVGIPGSGKSSLAEKLENKGYFVACADRIRGQLYGDENIQGDGKAVFDEFFKQLGIACRGNRDIVVDNTNIRKKYRKQLVQKGRAYGYLPEIWYVNTPLDTCLKRNKKRSRVVPEEVICKMYEKLNAPGNTLEEEGAILKVISNTKTKYDQSAN